MPTLQVQDDDEIILVEFEPAQGVRIVDRHKVNSWIVPQG